MITTDKDALRLDGIDQLGKTIDHYNGAERYNIFSENENLKENEKLIKTLMQLSREYGRLPSYGLKLHTELRLPFKTHFVMELNEADKFGIFVYDQKRHLSVKQVQNAEKSLLKMSLPKGMIFATRIGMPAQREVERINSEYKNPLIKLEYLSSITKRFELNIVN